MRIDSSSGAILWAKKFGQKNYKYQQIIKTIIYNDSIIWSVYRLIYYSANGQEIINTSIVRMSSNGIILQIMSVWNIYHDPQFEINSFDIVSETEIMIISSSNTTHNTGSFDIGISLISSNFTCEWHYTWDVNNYNDIPKEIIIHNNYTYITSYNDVKSSIYFIKSDQQNHNNKALKSYDIYNSKIFYYSLIIRHCGFQNNLMLTSTQFDTTPSPGFQIFLNDIANNLTLVSSVKILYTYESALLSIKFISSSQISVIEMHSDHNSPVVTNYYIYRHLINIDQNGAIQDVSTSMHINKLEFFTSKYAYILPSSNGYYLI